MQKLIVSAMHVDETIRILQRAGLQRKEGIALWFAPKDSRISHCLEPLHQAEYDMFHIPRKGIEQILEICRTEALRLVAQVHSHPGQAFHSYADDRWAIPRHVGALSIVIPFFAERLTPDTFLAQAATFRLSAENIWKPVPASRMSEVIEVIL